MTEHAIQVFAVVNFVVIGLSHIVQPRVWFKFFEMLRQLGYPGVFVNAMLSLLVGSIIVAFHNVWTGIPMVLTLIGWAQVLKGLISLVAPAVGMKGLMRVSEKRAWEFQVGGARLPRRVRADRVDLALAADLVELRLGADVDRVAGDRRRGERHLAEIVLRDLLVLGARVEHERHPLFGQQQHAVARRRSATPRTSGRRRRRGPCRSAVPVLASRTVRMPVSWTT